LKVTAKTLFPVRVAYVWFVSFLCIILIAFLWYMFSQAATSLIEAMVGAFPGSFNASITGRESAHQLYSNMWTWTPIICALAVLLWAIMYTLRERRRHQLGLA